jgi:glycosyltransferase involved in cell wall biosynthesis
LEKDKNILIVSYTFPPYPGIGGRRWAKFSKYLAKNGYKIYVLCAKNPFIKNSLWCDDVKNKNIKVYELTTFYPKSLIVNPKNYFQKIKYRTALILVKFFSKGTPYDRGIFWKKKLLQKSTELIKKFDIKNVIVSSAPFSSAYQILDLKKTHSNLNFIVDFRDPWTWGDGYGFSTLNKTRFKFEKTQEERVVEEFNTICVPSAEMKEYFINSYNCKNNIKILPHGFDAEHMSFSKKSESSKVRMVLYGTLYSNQQDIYNKLADFLFLHEDKLLLDFYTSEKTYISFFESYNLINKSVNYFPLESPNSFFKKISQYDFVLIIQPFSAKDFITTKIYEVIYLKIPIILISSEGKLSQFIIENNLGYYISIDNFKDDFELFMTKSKNDLNFDDFCIDDFSFEKLTQELISYLV